MKALGESAWSMGLDATKPLQGQKGLRGKPMLFPLRRKRATNIAGFALTGIAIQPYEKVRRSQIAIVLWNFVFQDEMVAKRIPRQFADDPVILVEVVTVMSKNQIGSELVFQFLEINFDTCIKRREIAIIETSDHQLLRLD